MKQLRAHETDIEAKSVQLSALIKLFEVSQLFAYTGDIIGIIGLSICWPGRINNIIIK